MSDKSLASHYSSPLPAGDQITLLIQFPATNCSNEKENPLWLSPLCWDTSCLANLKRTQFDQKHLLVPFLVVDTLLLVAEEIDKVQMKLSSVHNWHKKLLMKRHRWQSQQNDWHHLYKREKGKWLACYFDCIIFPAVFLRQSFSGEKPPQCTTSHWATTNKRENKNHQILHLTDFCTSLPLSDC